MHAQIYPFSGIEVIQMSIKHILLFPLEWDSSTNCVKNVKCRNFFDKEPIATKNMIFGFILRCIQLSLTLKYLMWNFGVKCTERMWQFWCAAGILMKLN